MKKTAVLDPFNFVPLTRTPWAGSLISQIKSHSLTQHGKPIPELIGESWEISTDAAFPSAMRDAPGLSFSEFLKQSPQTLLGSELANRYNTFCPLLLKWLYAHNPLSVQLHPKNGNPTLRSHECGKPESWLVLAVEPGASLFLGLRKGVTSAQAREAFASPNPESVLFRYHPRVGDCISIPPGLVHALGRGILIAEPQYLLPGKTGVTWRLSDWGRTYDEKGQLCQPGQGKPRDLHLDAGVPSIAWDFPREKDAIKELVFHWDHTPRFLGNSHNPFLVESFVHAGQHTYLPLKKNQFSLVTCFAGTAELKARGEASACGLRAGESAFVSADCEGLEILLNPMPFAHGETFGMPMQGVAFFALEERWVHGIPE
jgi:mannose-6-phosphate isomerase